MKRTLLLWDIDGTLLLTAGAGMRSMVRASQKLYGDAFRWDGIQASGRLDTSLLEEALAQNGHLPSDEAHRQFHDAYLVDLEAELLVVADRVRAMPGVREAIATLRGRAATRGDVVQGLLTGNYARAVPLKLRAAGYEPSWFEIGAFGDDARTRPDLVLVALRKCRDQLAWSPEPRNVIVIGDTPLDIDCAHAHGCVAFAVATGRHGVEELSAADVVVESLADPKPLFALL